MTLRKEDINFQAHHFCDTMLGYNWALLEFTKRSPSEPQSNLRKCEQGIVGHTQNQIEPVRIITKFWACNFVHEGPLLVSHRWTPSADPLRILLSLCIEG